MMVNVNTDEVVGRMIEYGARAGGSFSYEFWEAMRAVHPELMQEVWAKLFFLSDLVNYGEDDAV
jgi:hypothetical protein